MRIVFSFFFATFFFLWKPVETVGNCGKRGVISAGLGSELEDSFELSLNDLGQGKGIEGIALALEFRQPVGMNRRGSAGAEPLAGGLRRLVAPAETRADADLAVELDRGQAEVLEEAQLVAVEIVDGLQRLRGIIP